MAETLKTYRPTMREGLQGLLARNWYGDDRKGYSDADFAIRAVESIPLLGTAVGGALGSYDVGRAGASGDYLGAGLLAGASVLPLPAAAERTAINEVKEAAKGIRAYHGSPHDFDRFSLDAIGTGEGAQAYGHGLYFADNEGVARSYRNALSSPDNYGIYVNAPDASRSLLSAYREAADELDGGLGLSQKNFEAAILNKLRNPPPDAPDFWREQLEIAADELEAGKFKAVPKNPGSMYEVNIKADPETFLDWDKPLSEQPQKVRQALGLARPDEAALKSRLSEIEAQLSTSWDGVDTSDFDAVFAPRPELDALANEASQIRAQLNTGVPEGHPLFGVPRDALEQMTGEKIARPYSQYMGKGDNAALASQALREAGIPGVKYLDGNSRSAGDGSRNYVVFDDSLIEIIRKYGIAGLLGTGALAASQSNEAQAGGLLPPN